MPLVHIHLRAGKSPEYLKDVANSVHDALVATANVPQDDRFQIIHQHGPEAMIAHPTYGGVSRSQDLIIIEITLNTGRTVDIKKALYAAIASNLGKTVDVRADDVMVSLTEVVKENWSFGGGKATYA
jgi:4-oxalocrotonate tautomerase